MRGPAHTQRQTSTLTKLQSTAHKFVASAAVAAAANSPVGVGINKKNARNSKHKLCLAAGGNKCDAALAGTAEHSAAGLDIGAGHDGRPSTGY